MVPFRAKNNRLKRRLCQHITSRSNRRVRRGAAAWGVVYATYRRRFFLVLDRKRIAFVPLSKFSQGGRIVPRGDLRNVGVGTNLLRVKGVLVDSLSVLPFRTISRRRMLEDRLRASRFRRARYRRK